MSKIIERLDQYEVAKIMDAISKLEMLGYMEVAHFETDPYRTLITAQDYHCEKYLFRLKGGRLQKKVVHSSHSVSWEDV